MDLTIQRLNGEVYTLSDYGIKTLDFRIDAPSPRVFSEVIEGRDGFVDLGAVYEGRASHGSFYIAVPTDAEYPQIRNDVFRMFASREQFYVIDSREPGRRWLVRSNGFSPEQITANKGRFTVDFTSPRAYCESTVAESQMKTTSSFTIINAGDKTIDPREDALVITYTGASTNLKITNTTTGDTWQYTGASSSGNSIVLDGIRSTKNGLTIFGTTNRKLITLAPGNNAFTLTGASGSYSVKFEFRNQYL